MVFMSIGKCGYRVRAWPLFWRYRDCGRPAFWSYPYAGVSRRPLCQKHAPYPLWFDPRWHGGERIAAAYDDAVGAGGGE